MQYKQLGRTGIEVSTICLGTMTWGSQNTQDEAFAQLDASLEAGVNFIDTAELYPTTPLSEATYGGTERIIGAWMTERGNRDRIVLATKIAGSGRTYIRGGGPMTADGIVTALDASLARLKTDYVDLYQLHWPNRGHYHFRNAWSYDPSKQDTDKVVEDLGALLHALDTQVKAGKIRAIGVSNDTVWGTQKLIDLAERHGLPRVASVQNEYNLLYRPHDLDFAELSHHEQVGLLAYSPLAAGLLSGKYIGGSRPDGSRLSINGDLGGRFTPHQEPAVEAYVALARDHGIDPSQLALAFVLSRPFTTAAIIGATTMEQLAVNLSAADLVLTPELVNGIRRIHRLYPMPI
ncbi:aldo/keto reductase [Rhizobium sp. Leaf384]|uniref:aldo/keto reductase n=1 Tax=unclassified Rhizobium TaxID=2613769 RepID=UPI00071364D6|nr:MULTISPECIES: aldo/keto reductase [unclassified Rhizobium]KQR73323.1 aldo/keto reductase [Rhizobium sp. Leaf341]KQS80505.1 aldo/keto reductase [Rhizobium sp. Leaf384]KQS86557.1 aldo/keto reductase [Rhizobium sp. Leaf383]